MLEGERFSEAAQMLQFLLQCQSDDPSYKEEWQSLLDWLSDTFPHTIPNKPGSGSEAIIRDTADADDADEQEETESELFKRHVRAKAANDSTFADKLLAMLAPHSPAEKQMMALEQLSHLERRTVAGPLKQWLEHNRLHPLVQFRGLQALRNVGETGTITIYKLGQTLTLSIGETPLHYDQFPGKLKEVLSRTKEMMDKDEPGLAELADVTWRDFLAFLYGTSVYEELLQSESRNEVWACALHQTLIETTFGHADNKKITGLYDGLSDEDARSLHKAQQVIKLFLSVISPGEP